MSQPSSPSWSPFLLLPEAAHSIHFAKLEAVEEDSPSRGQRREVCRSLNAKTVVRTFTFSPAPAAMIQRTGSVRRRHVFPIAEPIIFFGCVEHEVRSKRDRLIRPQKICIIGPCDVVCKPVEETIAVSSFERFEYPFLVVSHITLRL